LKKKHTLPNYKLRYKPFFEKSEPGEEMEELAACSPGMLQVTIMEVPGFMEKLVECDIYCSLAVDEYSMLLLVLCCLTVPCVFIWLFSFVCFALMPERRVGGLCW
jgi:hypothetical protein